MIVEIDGGNTTACRPARPSEVGSCKTKDIAFCGFGITKSWQISTASMRRSLRSWAASPPPKPSPIEGGGLQGENNVHDNDTEGAPPSAS